jgi:hypothetical protein
MIYQALSDKRELVLHQGPRPGTNTELLQQVQTKMSLRLISIELRGFLTQTKADRVVAIEIKKLLKDVLLASPMLPIITLLLAQLAC